ncbi:hypothetical protein QYH69_35350 [Paraburkholderia sp. SARCC-3016]|uniref:hypothetical protein n=1 Tax=Paraburkholderia sp. SARCC-3016 TaxID=3058611 RepID=UPI0028091AAF|nr:hypothetical protein [Paraburkholderia sp. SARCC-3016]MDQ7982487.1 hypothetical protein [Paraburkholderia sp. SARCC-3016]
MICIRLAIALLSTIMLFDATSVASANESSHAEDSRSFCEGIAHLGRAIAGAKVHHVSSDSVKGRLRQAARQYADEISPQEERLLIAATDVIYSVDIETEEDGYSAANRLCLGSWSGMN